MWVVSKEETRSVTDANPVQDGAHAIPMVNTAALKEAEKPDESEMPAPPDSVVDDPSLLKNRDIILKGKHNVMACTWKMAVFSWRNFS